MMLPKAPCALELLGLLGLCSLLLCPAAVTGARQRSEDGSRSAESVSRARCASRCLSLHDAQVENNGSLEWCQNHKQCAKCLEPCKDSWDTKRRGRCGGLCELTFPRKHWECLTSCEFLRSVMAAKQGDCPPADRASGFAAACVESCEEDAECPAQKKCCPNGCGHTCQPPKNLYKGVPLRPRKELTLEEWPPGRLDVRWSSRFNVSAEPVVYVLQRRWNHGIQPSEDAATPWQEVAQTTALAAQLQDTKPGRWYQFRVAAVNIHGTRGFTTPSRHIQSSRDPSSPPAPSDLHVSNMTFGPGRAVQAQLGWSSRGEPDLPVHHYKVSWSWSSTAEPPAPHSAKRRKTVRVNRVDLESMRSNRNYSVEVQAVSLWGQKQLKGPKTVLRFNTQPSPSPTPARLPPEDMLDVGTPFYQDGQLQVRVYWQSSTDPAAGRYRLQWGPEHCTHNRSRPTEKLITRDNFASLPGLLFSCKYAVLLQPISSNGSPPAESISFFTPSCATIQAKSAKPIGCSGEAPDSQKVQARAENLTASFDVRGVNVTAVFSWALSAPRSGPWPTGFQVTWAEATSHGHLDNSKIKDNNNFPQSLISQSQILPPEQKFLVVSGLRLASPYRLEVQAFAAEGEGPATSRIFQTPGSSSTSRKRTRPKEHRYHQPIIERH